ncbi:MAG: transcription termination factor Rho [Lachnospiraceae bacterium]|nr:transcription termination factor Rho [Lachnospiraceae bacterium]MBR3171506.1 transcription termination factor Rho [Lachnospiraceae bacterium]
MTKERYQSLPVKTLRELAKARGIKGMSTQKKAVIIEAMLELDAKEAAAEKAAAAEIRDKAPDCIGAYPAGNGREEDNESPAEPSETVPAAPTKRVPKTEETEQAAPYEAAKTEPSTGEEKREEKRDKSVYVPGAIPGDQGNTVRGLLEIMTDGFGFLRSANFLPGEEDVYVSPSQIRRFNLKTGDMVEGNKREKAQGEKYGALIYVSRVNDRPADEARRRFTFENMTPIFPNRRIRLERPDGSRATRIVDLISPIGYGQRGMIVSPPKAGKTTLLKDIAKSILTTNPNTYLIILLIDERPEEVTDMKESVKGKHVEILYSTFDETPEHHKRVSEMVIERAKRLVEQKEDVIILLDSITRLARAYNIIVAPSGRTLSGGLDPTALYMPKRFFGAARNMREGGSLTILATALVDTGSKMDDVVYEEFKGTGNMELILDRKLQERRMFPAIDIVKSGTRREDLLLTMRERKAVDIMRRRMNGLKAEDAVETIIDEFTRLPTNEMVVDQILAKWK